MLFPNCKNLDYICNLILIYISLHCMINNVANMIVFTYGACNVVMVNSLLQLKISSVIY